MADIRRRNKAGLYHVAHKQVADPFSVLAVSLVALLGLGIFGMREGNKTGFFKDVEDRNPVFARRFHTDFRAIVIGKPCRQILQPFGERREACLFILGTAVRVSNTNAGIYPSLVNIKATTIFAKDSKQ